MKTNEIKHHLMNGTLEDAIKSNNRQWFLIVVLILTIFIGHSTINYNRLTTQRDKIQQLNDSITYKNTVIGIQDQALDSCVYFYEIKNR